MSHSPLQFVASAEKTLPPSCLICGEETQLIEEARAGMCRHFSAEQRVSVDLAKLQPSDKMLGQSGDLFGCEAQLYQLNSSGKPSAEGLHFIEQLHSRLQKPDRMMVLLLDIDYKLKKAVWFKKLGEMLPTVLCNRLSPEAAQPWLQRWLQQHDIRLSADARQFLALQTEGNLFAARQAIAKLALRADSAEYDMQAARTVLSDGARYDILDLSDAIYAGEPQRALTILRQLHADGVATVLIQWSILSVLNNVAALKNGNKPFAWGKQLAALKTLAQKINDPQLYRLTRQAAHADRAIKGVADGDALDILSNLAAYLAGRQGGVKIMLPYFSFPSQ